MCERAHTHRYIRKHIHAPRNKKRGRSNEELPSKEEKQKRTCDDAGKGKETETPPSTPPPPNPTPPPLPHSPSLDPPRSPRPPRLVHSAFVQPLPAEADLNPQALGDSNKGGVSVTREQGSGAESDCDSAVAVVGQRAPPTVSSQRQPRDYSHAERVDGGGAAAATGAGREDSGNGVVKLEKREWGRGKSAIEGRWDLHCDGKKGHVDKGGRIGQVGGSGRRWDSALCPLCGHLVVFENGSQHTAMRARARLHARTHTGSSASELSVYR